MVFAVVPEAKGSKALKYVIILNKNVSILAVTEMSFSDDVSVALTSSHVKQ